MTPSVAAAHSDADKPHIARFATSRAEVTLAAWILDWHGTVVDAIPGGGTLLLACHSNHHGQSFKVSVSIEGHGDIVQIEKSSVTLVAQRHFDETPIQTDRFLRVTRRGASAGQPLVQFTTKVGWLPKHVVPAGKPWLKFSVSGDPLPKGLHFVGESVATPRFDVVFVHGLWGDAFTTWTRGGLAQTLWPALLLHEHGLPVSCWTVDLPLAPVKIAGGVSRANAARLLLNMLAAERTFGSRPIVFVGHSLGGNVVKEALRLAWDAREADPRFSSIFQATKNVCFVATPHDGAALASLVLMAKHALQATITLEELTLHNEGLLSLREWFTDTWMKGKAAPLCLYETLPVVTATIVAQTSSVLQGAVAQPVPENHIEIAKPGDRTGAAHIHLINWLKGLPS